MPKRLLDRQISLIHHLTSAEVIFGAGTHCGRDLEGLDTALLRAEACFSHEKRMEKIAAVFPRTFALLGDERDTLAAEFAASCPPVDIGRIENARQFYGFLAARWRQEPPRLPFLPDIAGFELACATSRAAPANDAAASYPAMGVRRRPGVALLRSAYDLHAILVGHGAGSAAPERDTALAILFPPDADLPLVYDLTPSLFDLLTALERWTDAAVFAETPGADALIAELAEAGLVEMRP
jgi:hypothetical protein